MERIAWVDNAKAICIFFVIWGHMSDIDPIIKNAIYIFHVPMFLFLTGYLGSGTIRQMSAVSFLNKNIAPYLRVYAFFSVGAIAIWYALENFGEPLTIVIPAIKGALYGIHGKERLFLHNDAPLWYLPFLTSTIILSYVIYKLHAKTHAIGITAYLLFSIFYSGPRLPWSVDVAGVGIFSLFIGGYFKSIEQGPIIQKLSKLNIVLIPMMLLGVMIISNITGLMNINCAEFGTYPLLSVLGILLGIALVYTLSKSIPSSRILKRISSNTLLIFCIHIYLIYLVRKIPSFFDNIFLKQIEIALLALLILLCCLFLSEKASSIFKKFILLKSDEAKGSRV